MDKWTQLSRLWERTVKPPSAPAGDPFVEHHAQTRALASCGIAVEDALLFLNMERPSLEGFKTWIAARTRAGAAPSVRRDDDILSADALAFWDAHGYLVLRGAVPKEQCHAVQAAIWDYLGAHPDDPASWYQQHAGKRGLMLQLSDHPALDANRHNARIRHAYEQLYGTDAIFKTIDKVSFNPPETGTFRFQGSPLHWDVSLALPIPLKLQGLLYLGDCTAHDGAFQCVPGFHKRIGSWLDDVPHDVSARDWALRTLTPDAVPGEAGDFVIWHQALPHCASPNRGTQPRMVQYLTYLPDQCVDQRTWI
jgi:hypothetical protein